MKVLTERDMILSVAARWRSCHVKVGKFLATEDEQVFLELLTLPPSATAEQVAEITGNPYWTALWCENCGNEVTALAIFETQEAAMDLCADCMKAALFEMEVER